MKTIRLFSILPLVAAFSFLGFAASPARAHDPEEHHYEDHVRADRLRDHSRYDRYHAERALDRAFHTGDPRDFDHALRDLRHAERARRDARDARDHARDHHHDDH
jgi:hypothetical protein